MWINKRNCDICGKYYEGRGQRFCSKDCLGIWIGKRQTGVRRYGRLPKGLYERNCDTCGKWYRGQGPRCCSQTCGQKLPCTQERKEKMSQKRIAYWEKKKVEIFNNRIPKFCEICKKEYFGQGKRFCSRECSKKWCAVRWKVEKHPWLGKKHTEEYKQKMSEMFSGEKGNMYGVRGKHAPGWRGGKCPLYDQIRHMSEYNRWRKEVYKRDYWTCQLCHKKGGRIEADHCRVPFVCLIFIHKIVSLDQARECKELWDINNGRTLCRPCHEKTETWGFDFKKWEKQQLEALATP